MKLLTNTARALQRRFVSRLQTGQGLVEYTLLMALASVVAVGAVTTLGSTIQTKIYNLVGSL